VLQGQHGTSSKNINAKLTFRRLFTNIFLKTSGNVKTQNDWSDQHETWTSKKTGMRESDLHYKSKQINQNSYQNAVT